MASINQSIVHFERLNLNGWRLCCQIRRVLKPMSVVLSHKHILIECIGVALVNAAIHDLSTQLYTTSSASCLTSPPPKGKSFHHFTSSTAPYPTFSSGNNNFLNQIGLGDLENAWGTTFDLNLTHINFICVLQQKKKGGRLIGDEVLVFLDMEDYLWHELWNQNFFKSWQKSIYIFWLAI